MKHNLIAENENDISRVMALLNDDAKISRLKKMYSIDEILEILGYYDGSMDDEDILRLESTNCESEFEYETLSLGVINGNFEEAIARNKRFDGI